MIPWIIAILIGPAAFLLTRTYYKSRIKALKSEWIRDSKTSLRAESDQAYDLGYKNGRQDLAMEFTQASRYQIRPSKKI